MKREYNKPILTIEEISLINAITVSGTVGNITELPGSGEVVEDWDEFFN